MAFNLTGTSLAVPKITGNSSPLSDGLGTVAVGGLTSPYAIPAAVYQNRCITVTGTLTGNFILYLPLPADGSTINSWRIFNNTSGAFTLSVQGVGGVGSAVAIAQGKRQIVEADNTGFAAVTAAQ